MQNLNNSRELILNFALFLVQDEDVAAVEGRTAGQQQVSL